MRTGYWVSKHRKRNSDINTNKNNNVIPERSGEIKPIQYTIIGFGLIAGLISSLAVSGLILMVEKVTAVPVGTFYMVLMAALPEANLSSVNMIVSGLLLHLISGSIIGLAMSIPFTLYKENYIPIHARIRTFVRTCSMVHLISSCHFLDGTPISKLCRQPNHRTKCTHRSNCIN